MSNEEKTETIEFENVWAGLVDRDELLRREASATVSHAADPTETFSRIPSGFPGVKHLFVAGRVIGSGGNGEVLSATQVSLDRQIAIKRPHATAQSAFQLRQILREARVIGYLEHPNIPPVHFVGEGEHEEELIIGLKHIEGETFLEDLPRGEPSRDLDDDIETLLKICDAVGYAHDRGVLHLDIKPDNVMIGRYGEVYVLDWGLAVAWRDDVPDVIPRPVIDGRLRGTPSYVAPELIEANRPTPASDVFMLGGLLYRLITGYPPNQGGTIYEVLANAHAGKRPPIGHAVPRALAEICERALATRPQDRFVDANAFRDAVTAYRRNRRRYEALSSARRCVKELSALVSNPQSPQQTPVPEVYRAFGATRQAIDEAERLEETGEHEVGNLRKEAVQSVLEWELERDNPGGAEALLAELDDVDPDLRARVEALAAKRAKDLEELEQLRHEIDPNVARWPRFLFWISVGFVILLTELVPFLMGVEPDPERVLGGHLAYLGLLGAVTIGLRKKLLTNRTNRASIALVWVLSLFGLALRAAAYFGRFDLSTTMSLDLLLVALVATFGAFHLDRRILVAPPLYLTFAVIAAVFPAYALLMFGGGHFVALTAIAAVTTFVSPRQ